MEKKPESTEKLFGLVGKNIAYSFSREYFTKKFKSLQLHHCRYINFDLDSIDAFPDVLKQNPHLKGLNVTIPYKEKILPYVQHLSREVNEIGAVNTITFTKEGLKGHNTDAYGFKRSFAPLLQSHHNKALILGTGGASKAVAYTLNELRIPYTFVSRTPAHQLTYADVTEEVLQQYRIIINCTPLGTAPQVNAKPELPYHHITPQHLLYDLVYNPSETAFLKAGKEQGATVCNGLDMLRFQAERAWAIWNA